MPWCEECAKFWNPSSMGGGGECPTCGGILEPSATAPDAPSEAVPSTPWHLKVLVVALVVYLAFRAFQGVQWLMVHA